MPSKKPPHDRRDLANDLSVDSILELLRTYGASGIAMNGETGSVESATTAKITTVPSEKEIERLLAGSVSRVWRRFSGPAVDDNECGVGE